MLTDDDITTLLCRGFARATADLDPEPDLVHVVRRRYLSARRRRLVVGVAVPAAALAAGAGLALAGKDTPGHTAVGGPQPPATTTSVSRPRTSPVTSAPIKPASYRVVLSDRSAPAHCPANATAPVSKTANPRPGVWFWTNGECFFVGVGGADTKPGRATPLHITGYPGIYSTLEHGVRTIYAPGIGGRGWWVLDMPATVPQETAVRVLVPAN
jgi:hypothetical protein